MLCCGCVCLQSIELCSSISLFNLCSSFLSFLRLCRSSFPGCGGLEQPTWTRLWRQLAGQFDGQSTPIQWTTQLSVPTAQCAHARLGRLVAHLGGCLVGRTLGRTGRQQPTPDWSESQCLVHHAVATAEPLGSAGPCHRHTPATRLRTLARCLASVCCCGRRSWQCATDCRSRCFGILPWLHGQPAEHSARARWRPFAGRLCSPGHLVGRSRWAAAVPAAFVVVATTANAPSLGPAESFGRWRVAPTAAFALAASRRRLAQCQPARCHPAGLVGVGLPPFGALARATVARQPQWHSLGLPSCQLLRPKQLNRGK